MGGTRVTHIQNLGHRFDSHWLFRHVEADIVAGDRLLVRGQNGSGKSTFLRSVAGLIRPREGSVELPDRVGYAAIDLSVYPHLTVEEHLQMAASLRRQDSGVDWIERVQLGFARSKIGEELSTGMRARLKLALALHHGPDLLILDEPTAALDEPGRGLIDQLFREFPGGILYASNDLNDRRWATHEIEL